MRVFRFLALFQVVFNAGLALDIAVLDFYPEVETNSTVQFDSVSITPNSGQFKSTFLDPFSSPFLPLTIGLSVQAFVFSILYCIEI